MYGLGTAAGPQARHVQSIRPPTQGGMVRHRKIEAQQISWLTCPLSADF
jgi:hypothetical protein